MKQADLLLPDEIKEPAKEAITACRKVGAYHFDIRFNINKKTVFLIGLTLMSD